MMFDEYGVRIRPADIQKSEFSHTRSPMNSHSSGSCQGICQNYRAKRPLFKSRSAAGQVHCQVCETYLSKDGIQMRKLKPYCKCCNIQLTIPRGSFDDEEQQKNVRNVHEPWIKSESDDAPEKKSTPIYEEEKKYGKTYYELKEFIFDKLKPQANYQYVMLKHLLTSASAHKGEIAEALAFFNNKDTSKIEEVKPFLSVPVFDVLVKHGFVKEYYSNNKQWYELNVDFDNEYQNYEIDTLLENKIKEWNKDHEIPENQFESKGIDWTSYGYLLRTKELKVSEEKILTSQQLWIWSVTPANWPILQLKNVWGSRILPERISQKVKSGDQVAFYVIGTNSFKGIYEFEGDWYDSPGKTWDDDLEPNGRLRYLSQIKIKPIRIGTATLSFLFENMELFRNKPTNIRNLKLQGGSGYPSNNAHSLTNDDFEIILDELERNPETEQHPEETKQQERPDSEWIIKECPRCHYKIEGFEGDQQFSDKIEKMFGYRQMDPDDPFSKQLQSYCRKCRRFERVLVNEEPSLTDNVSAEPEYLTIFDSQEDGISIKHFEMQNKEFIQKGQNLTNDELVEKFRVGNMGGIRSSSKYNLLVLCDTESGHYNDEIDKEFEIIYYTGEGKTGDQTLTRGNLRIAESKDTPMFYFLEVPQEPGKNKRGALGKIYRFIGKVRYLKHAIKTENDINGNPHQVIKFLLEVEN